MVASIREFGFKIPVLARSNGEVVDGHLRLKAARKLGITEVPVLLCDEWTETQVKAFRLMVNRSVAWADWDEELLSLELLDLKDLDFDLGLTGFEDEELARLLAAQDATAGLCDEDATPVAPSSADFGAWRSVVAGTASAAVRRCHRPASRVATPGGCQADAHGYGSSVWCRVRP
jgi:ParB-like chromosome segregation protein Spo0J